MTFKYVDLDEAEYDMYHDWHLMEYGYYPISYYFKFCNDSEIRDVPNIRSVYKTKNDKKRSKRVSIDIRNDKIYNIRQRRKYQQKKRNHGYKSKSKRDIDFSF